MTDPVSKDLEVDIGQAEAKAIVEGKTAVPFKTFVQLILQRKVTSLFEKWGNDPVIVSSELLTTLASAQQDNTENKAHLVLVTLGVGVLAGVFGFVMLQIFLGVLGVTIGTKGLFYIAFCLIGLAVITNVLARMQKRNKGEKLLESMEKMANLVKK